MDDEFFRVDPREVESEPTVLDQHGTTATIDLSSFSLDNDDVTTSGSFDLGAIRATAFGKLLNALPLPALLIDRSHTIALASGAWGMSTDARASVQGRAFSDLVPDPRAARQSRHAIDQVFEDRQPRLMDLAMQMNVHPIWARMHIRPVRVRKERAVLILIEDLTAEKRQLLLTERHREELVKAHEDLERQVNERTAQLKAANEELTREIAERESAQEALREAHAALKRRVEERLQAEEALMRLATAVEQAAESIVITDNRRNIEYVNPAFEKIFGYAQDETLGRNPWFLISEEYDSDFYTNLFLNISKEEVWRGRVIGKSKSGERFHQDLTISPVRDASGAIINYVYVGHDVTQRVELEKQLFQAQKMEAIGTLAGGIAHDFNNVLTVALGYSEMLLMQTSESSPYHADLTRIANASRKGAELVKQLLSLSKKTEDKPHPMDLNHAVEQIKNLLSRTISRMIEIRVHLAKDLKAMIAEPIQMEQVLMNLVLNARDAMPEGGLLTLETANVFLDEEYCRAHWCVKPGEYVQLTVADTGVGMDKGTQGRMFEPFFSTKESGKGTGLGLAVVFGIVNAHGGHIWCDSEPGRGTTFKVLFPVTEPEAEVAEAASSDVPAGGTETILLVDDEEFVRDLGAGLLGKTGYRVLRAGDGREGLDIYRRHKDEISLVILDLIMPVMGGNQCLEELLRMRPNAKVLISSGHSSEDSIKQLSAKGARGFVPKPYQPRQMLRMVRQILDGD
jgi:PAS domain S-box-containing protein